MRRRRLFTLLAAVALLPLGQVPSAEAATSTTATITWRSDCYKGARVLCADQTNNKMAYFKNGVLVYELDARFGPTGSVDISPTRNGDFTIFRKVKNDWSTLYNSPMPDAMYFSGGEAVHYSDDFATNGWTDTSHGCINIRDRPALDVIYKEIKLGDPIHIWGTPPPPVI
ncbi:L,D-transpeptidase [Raineyella fluvialis]|uniref:L,D-transpeptidase family protein n=1 Tax=Raineyella fluvialis TaxID=2662261 RepID=A0A5Q2FBC8_9ACTN|nr:L,D-transpeptidase [Raineyella fluvialis]QGF23027.1 L,D-transpeptidase family protein [Raineyella fluvialis]